MSLSVRPRGIFGNVIASLIDYQTASYHTAPLHYLEQVHDIFYIERRVFQVNARFVGQPYGVAVLFVDIGNGVGRVVNVLRDKKVFELFRLVENFFDVGVFHVLKSLADNQKLSVGQGLVVGGVHANKSYARVSESSGVVVYQLFDNINARVEKIIICFGKSIERVTHNPKVAATHVNDIANVIVRDELEQSIDVGNNNFFGVRARPGEKFFVGVVADIFVRVNVRPNFSVTLYG